MPIRNLNWYNLQSTRRYPLDDSATGDTDDYKSVPNDILTDCHIRYPDTLGEFAYVQAVTVSRGVVSVLIGVSAGRFDVGKTVAAVTVARPVNTNTHYAISGLVSGVAGWLVFGPGVEDEEFLGRFATANQSLISRRCARPYKPLPIPSIKKLNVAGELSGVIDLAAVSPFFLTYDKPNNRVVFSLDQTSASFVNNPLSYFLGPCAERPESGTCPKTPISTINGIGPDCAGNIRIEFTNFDGLLFNDCGGLDIVTTYGLKQACQGTPPLPLFYSDLCCPQRFDTRADLDAADADPSIQFSVGDIVRIGVPPETPENQYKYLKAVSISNGVTTWQEMSRNDPDLKATLAACDWPDPTELVPDVVTVLPSIQDYPQLALPLCVDFCSCESEPPLFDAVQGNFITSRIKAPFGCIPCGATSFEQPETYEDTLKVSERNVYTAVDSGGVALSLLKNAASDWAFGRTVATQIRIGSSGLSRNGGIVINYRKTATNGVLQNKYFAAVIDVSRGQLRLLEYTNNNYIVVAAVDMPIKTERWYKLAVTPQLYGTTVYIRVDAAEMAVNGAQATIANYSVPLSAYEPQTGAFGLYAAQSYTHFNVFTVA